MSPEGYAYVAGGAGTEETMRENRAAFERWRIVPRMLRDVSVAATADEVLGTPLPSPFVLCPIGVLEMAHRDADVAVARAAAAEGIPFVFSNQASRPMEETARAMGDAPRWFQLYWSTSNELVASLVSRAERCGCTAIVLTLDTTMLGWRIRDLDLAYLPFLRGKGIAQYTSDPVFVEALQETLRQEPPPDGPHHARRDLDAARARPARIPARGSRTSARASRARRCGASSRRTRGRRCPGTTSRSSASGRGCRSCSRGSSTPPMRSRRSSTGWAGSSSRTTAAARSTARSRRWTRSRRSSRRSPGASRSSSTAASAPAPTSSERSRSAPRRSGSDGPTCGGSRQAARTASARSIRNFRADFDLTMGLAGVASVRDIGRDNVTRV